MGDPHAEGSALCACMVHPALQVPELSGRSEAEAQCPSGSEDAGAFAALGLLHTLTGRGCTLMPFREPHGMGSGGRCGGETSQAVGHPRPGFLHKRPL